MKLPTRLLLVPLLLSTPLILAQAAEMTPARPRLQDDPPVWASSFDEAVSRARVMKGGRVFVELREPSCTGCERMDELLYPSASFRAFMRDKAPVVVELGSPEGQRLAGRFGVRSAPAWLVLTPDLLLCGKQEGESSQSVWIERFVATEREWALFLKKLDDEKKAPGDAAAAFAVGEDAYRRYGDAVAEPRFRRVADDPKAPADLRGRSLGYLAGMALEARRFDDAEKALKRILETSDDPALREKAELRLADVEIGRGERSKATGLLKSFLARHPDSQMRAQAEAVLKALGGVRP